MKQLLIFILCLSGVTAVKAGVCNMSLPSVTFSFPALPEGEVIAYYFEGAKLDSLVVQLDKEGRGSGVFPRGYQGFVQAVVNKASLVEFIAGEEKLFIESDDIRPANQNVSYGDSEENRFFFSVMEGKRENEQPSLYAARFIEINTFTDSLFLAENKQDTATIRYVKQYLQNEMDWEALYTAGQFWTMVHNYTLSMFNKESYNKRPLVETQEAYAAFVRSLLTKVEGDLRTAMLESILQECDDFGWEIAKGRVNN